MPAARSLLATWVVCLAVAGTARADTVDDLVHKLRSDPDYKVRLSAALNLGKLGDRRAIGPLIDALGDGDRTVRSVAAGALGKLVDAGVPADLRERATVALAGVALGDPEKTVRDQAQKAHAALNMEHGVYVEVGPMGDGTRQAPRVPAMMRQHVVQSLGRRAPRFIMRWPTGRPPSDAELKRRGTSGYFIDGSLTALELSRTPPHVTCHVSLYIATFPGKSMFAFSKGGGEVDAAGGSDSALAAATSECVGAVLDNLVGEKIVPTIRQRGQ